MHVAMLREDDAMRGAADGDLSPAGLIDRIAALLAEGQAEAAERLYTLWLAHNGMHPAAYAARFNFAVFLTERGALRRASAMLRDALVQKPDFAPAQINLGTVLERLDDRPGAIAAWHQVATQFAHTDGDAVHFRRTALNQTARVLENARLEAPAEAAMRASLELDPSQREVIQHYVAMRQAQCAWPALQDLPRLPAADQMRAISPLSLAAQIDDPVLQLANAHHYHRNDAGIDGIGVAGRWPPPQDCAARRLRIGYVSSDLREHAVGYLVTRLFGLHDRRRVEVFAYYCGPARDDALKAAFRAAADHWRDIGKLTDRQAAALIVRDGIDILVDMNGYTKDGRIKLFALRPAPVVVNWLGYPGSLGSAWHHYILADDTIVPPQDDMFFSERVIRLPCYQPNDRGRAVSAQELTRAQAGLPESGCVFCVFNGAHKITPPVFAVWMHILAASPGSVLWLLCDAEDTRARLRGHAEQAGIDPARLVFAGRMGNADHLARYRLADLFLDTAPYGAHTTASDALWMGVPVLTRAGNSFAARVCASLVRAAGLPELVCGDWAQYQALAIHLAQTPAALATVKAKLRAAQDHCTLFDTEALVRALEDSYAHMWQDYCADRLPQPRLDHLPRYRRIGCDPARDPLPSRDQLIGWYQTALAYEDADAGLPADGLLWPPAQSLAAPRALAA